MSELHANFLLNLGEADACEVETLGETVRSSVRDKHGIELKWEIRRMGHFVPGREVREFLDGDVVHGGRSSMTKHVAVLMGGWSNERPVSLMSGTECAEALRSAGYHGHRGRCRPRHRRAC